MAKIFDGNLSLKIFELNLKVCCYNSFFWLIANQKLSKRGFHWYMVYQALERHGGAMEVKLEQKSSGKENFDRKWRMAVYSWIKVKLLYYSRIKYVFQCFLQLGGMCFSSWDITLFVASVFRNFAVESSETFGMKKS